MNMALEQMTSSLQHALAVSPSDETQRLAALVKTMKWLGQVPQLTGLVRSLYDDPQAAGCRAMESYLHPLGFRKLLLINSSPEFELRLHIWKSGFSPGAEHIHNHRSAFVTTIIRGTYDMQVFQPDPAGMPVVEYREEASHQTGWDLTPVGTTGLRMVSSARLAEGTSYALASDVLHRVSVPQQDSCVTLVLRMSAAASPTRVFASPQARPPGQIPMRMMSEDDYRQQLAGLLRDLGS